MAKVVKNVYYTPADPSSVKKILDLPVFLSGEWTGDIGKDAYGNQTALIDGKLREANYVCFVNQSGKISFWGRLSEENSNSLLDVWGGVSRENTIGFKSPKEFQNADVQLLLPNWGNAFEDLENQANGFQDQPVCSMTGFIVQVSNPDFYVLSSYEGVSIYTLEEALDMLPQLTAKAQESVISISYYKEIGLL